MAISIESEWGCIVGGVVVRWFSFFTVPHDRNHQSIKELDNAGGRSAIACTKGLNDDWYEGCSGGDVRSN
jgi:hypothetical protein